MTTEYSEEALVATLKEAVGYVRKLAEHRDGLQEAMDKIEQSGVTPDLTQEPWPEITAGLEKASTLLDQVRLAWSGVEV